MITFNHSSVGRLTDLDLKNTSAKVVARSKESNFDQSIQAEKYQMNINQ